MRVSQSLYVRHVERSFFLAKSKHLLVFRRGSSITLHFAQDDENSTFEIVSFNHSYNFYFKNSKTEEVINSSCSSSNSVCIGRDITWSIN